MGFRTQLWSDLFQVTDRPGVFAGLMFAVGDHNSSDDSGPVSGSSGSFEISWAYDEFWRIDDAATGTRSFYMPRRLYGIGGLELFANSKSHQPLNLCLEIDKPFLFEGGLSEFRIGVTTGIDVDWLAGISPTIFRPRSAH